MCGMTRAFVADPEMPHKADRIIIDNIRACVVCKQACIGHMLNACAISCIQKPETGRELKFGKLIRASSIKRVLVVGVGPLVCKLHQLLQSEGTR